jgi:sulfur carrier protein
MVSLNGEASAVRAGDTVAMVLRDLGISEDTRGIAVAVDGEVVPRAAWESFALSADARLEVLTAMQGG